MHCVNSHIKFYWKYVAQWKDLVVNETKFSATSLKLQQQRYNVCCVLRFAFYKLNMLWLNINSFKTVKPNATIAYKLMIVTSLG